MGNGVLGRRWGRGVGYQGGTAGTEPDRPRSGGSVGQGGTDGGTNGPPSADAGDGGLGYPSSSTRGNDGGGIGVRGGSVGRGGGGGRRPGAIRVISANDISSANMSPTPTGLLRARRRSRRRNVLHLLRL